MTRAMECKRELKRGKFWNDCFLRIYGDVTGYGTRPGRVGIWIAATLIGFSLIYWISMLWDGLDVIIKIEVRIFDHQVGV